MAHSAIDANRIIPRLWQGSDPPRGPALKQIGVDVLVLCARERQAGSFPGVKVVRVPMDDGHVVPVEVALSAARAAALAHRQGARVLVCCNQGFNRSGLVTALALWMRGGQLSGRQCMAQVQAARRGALRNDRFAAYLVALPPQQQMRAAAHS